MNIEENEEYPKGWKTTCTRYVGIIDIMGFKNLVSRNSHNKVYLMMKSVSESLFYSQTGFGYDLDENDEPIQIVHVMTYSDSIMIFSKDNSKSCADAFIGCISFLSQQLFEEEIPHKGAVANGKMTIDYNSSIFFGQPLIDAFVLQDELQFYGIIAHSSAEFKKEFDTDENVLEYNCPFKGGKGIHKTILPGCFILKDPLADEAIDRLIKSVKKLRINTSGSLRKYIDNTIDYINYAKEELKEYLESNFNTDIGNEQNDIDLPF
ncbi:hypothetical protein G5B37_03700 [Rasiella rasia]|uniref:Guanylate cyclase domain-containing protein n=1 Tax=Rasiella rasia TaxID=2744027 RepID=A0A6G6GJC9_9FLAO|nr:hypothetical protein [Rasiella rasia]QIE58696.1 hypothetical protein G5B37_03700 [Rasiella rasia]